jgi:hypothetical protein
MIAAAFNRGSWAAGKTTDVFFILDSTVRIDSYASIGHEVIFDEVSVGGMFGEFSTVDGRPNASSRGLRLRSKRACAEHCCARLPPIGVRRRRIRIVDLSRLEQLGKREKLPPARQSTVQLQAASATCVGARSRSPTICGESSARLLRAEPSCTASCQPRSHGWRTDAGLCHHRVSSPASRVSCTS